jgi:hypothetical protein
VGLSVVTPDGTATVRQIDLLRETVTVDGREPGSLQEWPVDSVRWEEAPPAGGRGGCQGGGCRRGPA